MELMVNKEKKKSLVIYIFIDSEGQVPFAYVPVRDQNLVVWGKNFCLISLVFFISFWKRF